MDKLKKKYNELLQREKKAEEYFERKDLRGEKMQNTISICGKDIQVKEYNGQRVVTFRDIDNLHQRPEGTARRNFNSNKKHFTENEDFFVRNSYEGKVRGCLL